MTDERGRVSPTTDVPLPESRDSNSSPSHSLRTLQAQWRADAKLEWKAAKDEDADPDGSQRFAQHHQSKADALNKCASQLDPYVQREIAQPQTGWQPIDTGPQEKRVLIWEDGSMHVAFWSGEVGAWTDTEYRYKPSHWMPLPDPPKAGS